MSSTTGKLGVGGHRRRLNIRFFGVVTLPPVITLLVTLPTILVYIKGIVKVFQFGNITPCGNVIGNVTNHFG